MKTGELRDCPVPDLERIIESYPWYALARKELFLRMSAMGEEYRRDTLRHAVLYLYPDYAAFRRGYVLASSAAGTEPQDAGEGEYVCELDLLETGPSAETAAEPQARISVEPEPAPEPAAAPAVRVVYVGGDYFNTDDLRNVQGGDLSSLTQGHAAALPGTDSSEFLDETFYTETLARIYADQELYDRANEVYEKLILLYPEKSTYFAALKNDIKKHL